ncbi:hypothetical protein EWD52_23485 [Salmonella enterica subsp. enterica serovar Braenderup]|nr:hypothetical protein [Salmonella enterica subsp. enterica serovar Braenderup]ECD1500262.1 hypothetical protein [Salmonella enterica subsp. enterica serovar Braenderup]
MSDMYFDPTEFDFTNLVDVVSSTESEFKEATAALKDIGPDGGRVDDVSDLIEFQESQQEEPESDDPNDNINDLLYSDEDKEQAAEDFNYLPNDFVIDWGGYKATKEETLNKLKLVDEVEAKQEFLSDLYDKSEQGSRWLYRESGVSLRAIDNEINQLTYDIHNAPNATIKGQLYDQLIHKQTEREQLYADVDNAFKVDAAIKENAIKANTFKVNNLMQKKYADFEHVMGKALEQMKETGTSRVAFERTYTPWVAEKIYKAVKSELTENDRVKQAYANAEKRKAARSASNSSSSQRSNPQDAAAAELAALRRKMKEGGLTREEHSKMFNHLKD